MIKRRKPRPFVDIPTASMGDVAFNLISFFLVCSTVANESGVRIELPKAAELANLGKPPSIVVTLDQQADIRIQGELVGIPDLERKLDLLLAQATNPQAKKIYFKCDRGLDRRRFEPVIETLAKTGATIVMSGERTGGKPPRSSK